MQQIVAVWLKSEIFWPLTWVEEASLQGKGDGMTLISRISSGGRPEWLDKRRSARRIEASEVMPTESIHPDASSSPYEHLMAAFRQFCQAWRKTGEESGRNKEAGSEEESVTHTATSLASELARLDQEEKQRLLKKRWLDVVV